MGRKPAIDPKTLPSWIRVIEHKRSKGPKYKTYRDTWNSKTYKSLEGLARAYGLGGNSLPCPKPLNMRKGDGSSMPVPAGDYTAIPAIPDYVAKGIGTDASNIEEGEEQCNTARDVPGIMKEEKEKEKEENGHAAGHFAKEEEIAKKIDAPADAESMKEN